MARYPDLILAEPGLVSYWRLGETSGTTAADAFDGNGGTYFSAVGGGTGVASVAGLLTGDADSAIAFSSSQSVNVGNNSSVQLGVGSVECWVQTSQTNDGGYHAAIAKSGAYGLFQLNTGKFGIFDWGAGVNRDTGIAINDGQIHHLAVAFQSGVASGTVIYLDGQPVLTTVMTPSSQASNLNFAANNGAQALTGTIDEVALYNTVLTSTQVAAHYRTGIGGGPIAPSFLPARLGPRRTG